MKTIFQHIDTVREKPHHVRKQIAFGLAGGITTIIALVWLTASAATGTFAIKTPTFPGAEAQPAVITTTPEGNPNLAGAAAATDKKSPIHIEIVNTATTTPVDPRGAEQTVLPF